MSDSEIFVLGLSLFGGAIAVAANATGRLHDLYFRNNPGPGIVRAGVLASMLWIAFVLAFFADPSVRGVYVAFYLVMGYAVVKGFGQTPAMRYGAHARLDAGERRNVPAALVNGAFTLATGLIFGGSLWGEADPVGEGEGGWWIPFGFFLLGWLVLVVAFGLYLRREEGRFATRIRRDRSIADARAAATFLLGAAITLTDAVSGDFWGWRHGLLTFGLIAGMLLLHEVFAGMTRTDVVTSRVERPSDPQRILESLFYLGIAGVVWLVNRFLDATWGPG
jgi:hypothetical protein